MSQAEDIAVLGAKIETLCSAVNKLTESTEQLILLTAKISYLAEQNKIAIAELKETKVDYKIVKALIGGMILMSGGSLALILRLF